VGELNETDGAVPEVDERADAGSMAGPDESPVLVLTVAYNGAPFSGFARQDGLATVQGELEGALSTILRRPVEVACAGRTDAGVHALGQVVSCPISKEERAQVEGRNPSRLLRSLGALTADGISVRDVRIEHPGFSARFDAVSREYRYFIVTEPVEPVFMKDFSWWLQAPGLDVDAMREASRCLLGEHDFKSFCLAKSAEGRPTCRFLESIDFCNETVMGEDCLVVRVVGNAFLHNMVRTLVGTLVEVGCGRRDPAWVGQVLAARDRSAAGQTAPAQGLVFWRVNYEGTRRHPRPTRA
jgi:tRNA pseudouridine38-40 synthase